MTPATHTVRAPGRFRDDARTPRLKIAMLAPPWLSVPPARYGGTERVVSLLAEGLVEAGHDVTLYAAGDSTTSAVLRSTYAHSLPGRLGEEAASVRHALTCFRDAGKFDLIHDHTGPAALLLSAVVDVPVVHTVHGSLAGDSGEIYRGIDDLAPGAGLVSLTLAQRTPAPSLNWVGTCANGIDPDVYPIKDENGGGYLVFLGRVGPEKGCHHAIEVARMTGRRLLIAAKCNEAEERRYFRRHVEPCLDDRVRYVGEVDHRAKLELLRGAEALVFPVEWEEPFGLAMIEAMACGTPVVATRRGSTPEVVIPGLNGALVDDWRDMPDALAHLDLDRFLIRRTVLDRYTAERMVARYLRVYRRELEGRLLGSLSRSGAA